MFDPKVLLLCAMIGGGYCVYEGAIKPAAITVAHTVKAGATTVGHGLKWLVHR